MPGRENRGKEGPSGDSSPNTFFPSQFLIDFVCVAYGKDGTRKGSNCGATTIRS